MLRLSKTSRSLWRDSQRLGSPLSAEFRAYSQVADADGIVKEGSKPGTLHCSACDTGSPGPPPR